MRPPLAREIKAGQTTNCIAIAPKKQSSDHQQVYISLTAQPVIIQAADAGVDVQQSSDLAIYTFNEVFGQDAQQADVYERAVKQCVTSVTAGINATVFAYGQTGTGKTHTMFGDQHDEVQAGLAPRCVNDIFASLHGEQEEEIKQADLVDPSQAEADDGNVSDSDTQVGDIEQTSQVFLSILQIYNEVVTDLLVDKQDPLKIKMDSQKNFFADGLSQHQVSEPAEVHALIKKAYKNRAQSATNMNEVSSRSHMLLTLTVSRFDERDASYSIAKLNLVDLAGSERVKASGATGARLTEACHINLSLFTLARIVHSLEEASKDTKKASSAASSANYRDSKLTMLLKDSIGGNCQTTMFACLSPSADFCTESNNTLSFAHRCKQIQNVVRANKYRSSVPASLPVALKKTKSKKQVPWNSLEVDVSTDKVVTKFGKLHVLTAGSHEASKSIIMIHGCDRATSCGGNFRHFFPAFVHMGYRIIAVDMPGYGKSEGKAQSFRTKDILEPEGPAEVINELMSHY